MHAVLHVGGDGEVNTAESVATCGDRIGKDVMQSNISHTADNSTSQNDELVQFSTDML